MSRIRVLIAEDEPGVRQALSELIASEESLELVAAAAHAVQAVEFALRHRPDVALVDVKMPGGGGQRAAAGMRTASPQTRVLALSAHDDRASVMAMLRAGAVGYLVKGSSPRQIVEAIHVTALGQSALSAEVAAGVIQELAGQFRRDEEQARHYGEQIREIRRALGWKGLTLAFQPVADLQTGTVVGLEALARFDLDRWRSPEVAFREAAQVGLLVDLELAAIRLAIGQVDKLPASAFLSINLSPETAMSEGFMDAILIAPSDRVVIEITEHAQVADYAALNEALSTLREHGVRLAIDDAGAGFASLQHIIRLAPDFIKLDITLTRGIDEAPVRRALATALITFAAEIGAAIIAEGIETQGEFDTLRALGVPFGQGFYLAPPGPANSPISGIPSLRRSDYGLADSPA
jgi:EAL domain-containing protein (putative c-di-GMP-specific phosphodiesterase class I)/DNA-binding NarL/FixJ family response regulator